MNITNPARYENDDAADAQAAADEIEAINVTQRARELLQPGCREFCFVEESICSSDDAEKYQDCILRIASANRSQLEHQMDRAELRLMLESHATAYAQSGHVDSAYTPQLDLANARIAELEAQLQARAA